MNTDLESHGFEILAEWEIRKDKIKPSSLDWKESAGWIYAFATDDRVRYVGKTINVVRSRLDDYSHIHNDRVGALIKSALESGELLHIYGLRSNAIDNLDLEIEESKFIEMFKTDWNIRP